MTEPAKATLFDLDAAEFDLLAKIEALFQEPMDENIDPGAESERLVDEYLAALTDVQERLGVKLLGYVKAIKAKAARAALLDAEAELYLAEAVRLRQKAKDAADTSEFLQGRLKIFMERRGLQEFEAGTFKLKIVNQGGKLPLMIAPSVKPEDVAVAFRKEIPARLDFDREAIEAALKAGQSLELERTSELDGKPLRYVWARLGVRQTKLKIS